MSRVSRGRWELEDEDHFEHTQLLYCSSPTVLPPTEPARLAAGYGCPRLVKVFVPSARHDDISSQACTTSQHIASEPVTEAVLLAAGACRHGDRCSRLHNRPTISPTLLMQNMYQNPALNAPPGPDGLPIPVDPRKSQEHFEVGTLEEAEL